MYKPRCHVRGFLFLALVAILLPSVVVAQVRSAGQVSQTDVFASVQETLNDAADRTLASALASTPWMNASVPRAADDRESSSSEDPVVRLRAAIARVEFLRPIIEPILREEGVPAGLSGVVLVESGGLATALSPKGARGLWQLMPETARRYGLVVSDGRDGRLDVTKSTRAAARYLRDLHQQFGDWQLAFAAYNAGEQAVERAMGRIGRPDFPGIESGLPQETRRYVPAVLQAIERLEHHDFSNRARIVYAATGTSD